MSTAEPFPPPSRPRTWAVAGTAVVALGLAACGSPGPAPEKGSLNISPTVRPTAATLPQAAPVIEAECPYLDSGTVAQLNGEKVRRVRIDNRLDPPACFFYSEDERVQLSTLVAAADSATAARALVDATVPVGASERADLPGGWTGGRVGGREGGVIAAARGTRILVVRSGQEQSIKVLRIAETIASRLS